LPHSTQRSGRPTPTGAPAHVLTTTLERRTVVDTVSVGTPWGANAHLVAAATGFAAAHRTHLRGAKRVRPRRPHPA
jgi:hypothetical protein